MENIELRKSELREVIAVLEEKLAELRTKLHEVEQEQQHEAINHLDEYLKEVDDKYRDMKELWALVLDEVEDIFHPSEKPQ